MTVGSSHFAKMFCMLLPVLLRKGHMERLLHECRPKKPRIARSPSSDGGRLKVRQG